ncbi:Hypoxia up-regulated protein 1 [Lunasporangiospora selenospora]|uniref:Hypoxia up-regulated protein 1 n=1 Tax=Lunasporangiospora selenospora TaxID=979761 RepID=A0A9P6KHM9_9FUNG|nr:Hypoxia up-regulated protein 1 [Lunasporangiospora selenospora]
MKPSTQSQPRIKKRSLLTLGGVAALAALCLAPNPANAAVMSIDYGTDWFKVALVKPGIPLDIVLNAESKRKTASAMTIRGDERTFGSEALSLATRFPQDSFIGLKRVIGRDYDDQHCVDFRNTFTNNMLRDPVRGTAVFETSAGAQYSVEELVAMQFSLAKKQAEDTAGEAVKDVVITIPPYFSQYERQALLDSAELAGLRVISLIHDESAVALNYATSRTFPQEQCHIFYDMGAGSTVASLACFQDQSVKDVGKFYKTIQQVEIKSVGYDRTLGGVEIDLRLQKHLAEKFQALKGSKLSTPVAQNERAMAKLLKEANRVKQILSANTETMASIENLMEEHDFRVLVTRAELEDMSKDLLARVGGPIDAALSDANMKLSDIQSLVLVGGGVRVPSIQANLASIVGEDKIAKNVNGDEAAVMGAAFRAASLSRQFKVKEVRLKDISLFPIDVRYSGEPKEGSTAGKPFLTSIFSGKSTMGTRKIMSFKRVTDFDFDLQYGSSMEAELSEKEIAHVSLTGLTEAVNKFKDVSVNTPKVKVTIELSDSGVLNVQEAVATIETDTAKKATLAEKVKSFFGTSEKNEDVKDAEPKETDENSESDEGKKSSQGNPDSGKKEDPKESEKKDNSSAEPSAKNETVTTLIEKVLLNIKVESRGIAPLSDDLKKVSSSKLQRLDTLDTAKRAREEARNSLETFLYRGRDLLYKDEIIEVSTEEEREKLSSQLSVISEWLEDNEEAETEEFQVRLKDLRALERPISVRAAEQEEVQKLYDACDEILGWIKDKEAQQEALPLWQDGVVTTREIQVKGGAVEREMHKLMSKKKPKPKKVKETNKNETTSENAEATEEEKKPEGSTEKGENEKPIEQKDEEPTASSEEPEAEPAESLKHKKDEL